MEREQGGAGPGGHLPTKHQQVPIRTPTSSADGASDTTNRTHHWFGSFTRDRLRASRAASLGAGPRSGWGRRPPLMGKLAGHVGHPARRTSELNAAGYIHDHYQRGGVALHRWWTLKSA